jgi:GTP-binding protein
MAVCRIYEGKISNGQTVYVKKPGGESYTGKITKLYTFEGVQKKEVSDATSGDIVMIAGLPQIYIGETISTDSEAKILPAINIDEPTISLNFLVNDSPFAGKEGKFVTGRQIRERLEKELEINVGLRVDFSSSEYLNVFGRGELHIAILLENMRREGYELQVSQPQVIIKEENGIKTEPYEEVVIDVPEEFSGAVISKLTEKKGSLMNLISEPGSTTRLIFEIPTRGLLGYRGQFIIDTKGLGIIATRFIGFRDYAGEIRKQNYGSMVSMENGKALAFALDNLQQRGVLYIEPSEEIYEGQIIGNVTKGDDLSVNPTKGKQLTNMRASGSDGSVYLAPAWKLSIERAMEVMSDDDYIEITPKSVRLRKKYLNESMRLKAKRQQQEKK